jgi:hypothetical protein
MAGQGKTCSSCGRNLSRKDQYITLDGGEMWCAACWGRRFGPRLAPPGEAEPNEPSAVDPAADIQLADPPSAAGRRKPAGQPEAAPSTQAVAQDIHQDISFDGPATSKTSGLAIFALVAALVGIVVPVLGGLVAIALGAMALSKISKNSALRGSGLAIAGMVTGVVDVLGWAVLLYILISALR